MIVAASQARLIRDVATRLRLIFVEAMYDRKDLSELTEKRYWQILKAMTGADGKPEDALKLMAKYPDKKDFFGQN